MRKILLYLRIRILKSFE
uniref:Uncharacterized protein n=1 Tax=Arundo donax TaxID=35708 RepID=A0A0A9F4X9_ARUDO